MMSIERQLVAIKCIVAPGAFSGERLFNVQLANGESYGSLAPRQFCWNSGGAIVAIDEPTTAIDGYVAARVVEEIDATQALVEVPDGQIIAVDIGSVVSRPTSIRPLGRSLDVSV
jgi:hypothetical protein